MRHAEAILLVSFGGPECRADVLPFLKRVLRGRNVPRERMLEVAAHYKRFGGRSPINDQNRALIRALEELLAAEGPPLKVYWGNRNWHPLLADTMRTMAADGVKRAWAFVTSAFSSYSGCRQYLEDIELARTEAGDGAPEVRKLRAFYNHPGYIEAMVDRTRDALTRLPDARLVFTAHSIPRFMAETSPYVAQLTEACRLVAKGAGVSDYDLVYQSRSGAPGQPWLEPDILDHLTSFARIRPMRSVVLVPIGFVSDHMEVVYDLDMEARTLCDDLGLKMFRVATVGDDPRFVRMIRDLVLERRGATDRVALGTLGPAPDVCAADCCPAPQQPPRRRPNPRA